LNKENIAKLVKEEVLILPNEAEHISIALGDVRIKIIPKDGYSVSSDGRIKIALDLKLDDNLVAEGNARELVNKIQNLRKSADLQVTDRIVLGISSNVETEKALAKFNDYIKSETLAEEIVDIDGSNLRHSQEST